MSDTILVHGDQALFIPQFGPASIVVKPGQLKASGKMTLNGKKICIDGDEKKLEVKGCIYSTPQFSIPGIGTLKIQRLNKGHRAEGTLIDGKAVLLEGSYKFVAKFEVQTPAKMPPPPSTPDPMKQYSGQGKFLSKGNVKKLFGT